MMGLEEENKTNRLAERERAAMVAFSDGERRRQKPLSFISYSLSAFNDFLSHCCSRQVLRADAQKTMQENMAMASSAPGFMDSKYFAFV